MPFIRRRLSKLVRKTNIYTQVNLKANDCFTVDNSYTFTHAWSKKWDNQKLK